MRLAIGSKRKNVNVKKQLLSRLWNLRGWRNLVASVQGSCFNSQF